MPRKNQALKAIEDLENAGFLGFTSSSFDRAKWLRLALDGDPLQEECGRVFAVDSEDLFEQGPSVFLEEMRDFLQYIGTPIDGFEEIRVPHTETLLQLSDRIFPIASVRDWTEENPWAPAFLRFVGALDWLVRQGASGDRCYYTGLGNDAMICFLTPSMLRALRDLGQATRLADELFSLEEPIQ